MGDTKIASACALPDGQVLITRGLLERLNNESELAAVLGHECGHIVGEHSAVQAAWMQLNLSATTASNGDHPSKVETLAGLRAKIKELEVQWRENETAADLLAVQFISEAGYDPRGMEGVMRILERLPLPADCTPESLWTHPEPKRRLEDVDRWIETRFPKGIPSDLTTGLPLGQAKAGDTRPSVERVSDF